MYERMTYTLMNTPPIMEGKLRSCNGTIFATILILSVKNMITLTQPDTYGNS